MNNQPRNSKNSGRADEWFDFAKRLSNYISMQKEVAKKKGVWEKLQRAQTLTQARKIVWGVKAKGKAL